MVILFQLNKHLSSNEKDLDLYTQQLESFDPRTEELEGRMNERGDKLKYIKGKMNTVEDEVFYHFCQQIGVDNIR